MIDLTKKFSVKKLELKTGNITKQQDDNFNTIIIPIAEFMLDEKITDTKLWFDRVLLTDILPNYVGKTIVFPVNPIEGYIDGSVYLRDAHNPVDISSIKFIKLENNILTAELTMNFVFEFEGIGFKNEKWTKEVYLIID